MNEKRATGGRWARLVAPLPTWARVVVELWTAAACVATPFFVLLLAVCVTPVGRVAAVCGLAVWVLVPVGAIALGHRRWLLTALAWIAVLIGWVVPLWNAPPGRASEGSRISSRFTARAPYPRFSVANIVPEEDQLVFGTYLMPLLDALLDHRESAHLRALVIARYAEMDADERALGSAMAYAYSGAVSGQLYVSVPPPGSAPHPPVLLFLHGSAGNFRAYFHLLRPLADRHGAILVCPSFGFGNWQLPGGVEAVGRARRYAVEELGGDPERIVLIALSNGGRGATREVRENGYAYRALVFLSAVVERTLIDDDAFEAWRDRPVLFIHGTVDDRVPLSLITYAEGSLTARGARVVSHHHANQDHFLWFDEPELVERELDAFLRDAL